MTGDHYSVHDIGHGNAIGPGAQTHVIAVTSGSGLAEVADRLAGLRELLEEHSSELADPETARAAVDAAANEVREGRFDGIRVLLSSIKGAAPGVSAVTQAVQSIADLVKSMT
jgi:hypothetical protein